MIRPHTTNGMTGWSSTPLSSSSSWRRRCQSPNVGEFYKIDKLRMAPRLRPDLLPGIFLSGSSQAGLQAAQKLAATAIQYPKPAGDLPPARDAGIRIGIIARSGEGEAWQV